MRLKDLYGKLTVQQREALAARADIGPEYLYQLATRFKGKQPSLEVLARLSAADKRLKLAELLAEFTEPRKATA